jgi:hypothetical protein
MAGATPFGPKINQHGILMRGLKHITLEVGEVCVKDQRIRNPSGMGVIVML